MSNLLNTSQKQARFRLIRFLLARSDAPVRPVPLTLTPGLLRALLISQLFAVLWWLVSAWMRSTNLVPVWTDQRDTFLRAINHLADPFALSRFIYPPWTAPLLAPFGLLSIPLSVLIQTCLYFAILTLVIFKYGGSGWITLLTLSSYVALQATIELNLEWLVFIGLLVPPAFSGLFLFIKPQDALGVWLSFSRRDLERAAAVVLAAFIVSVLIWGFWPPLIWERVRVISLGQSFNMAPTALLAWPLSLVALAAGAALAWHAFWRRDPILGIVAWLFFVPYIAPYSLLPAFGLLAIRYPRFMTLVSLIIWSTYGTLVFYGLLTHVN